MFTSRQIAKHSETHQQVRLETKWGQVIAQFHRRNSWTRPIHPAVCSESLWVKTPPESVGRRSTWSRNRRMQKQMTAAASSKLSALLLPTHGRSMVVKFRQRASDVTRRIVRPPWPTTNGRPICHTGWKLRGLDGRSVGRPYPAFKTTFPQTVRRRRQLLPIGLSDGNYLPASHV